MDALVHEHMSAMSRKKRLRDTRNPEETGNEHGEWHNSNEPGDPNRESRVKDVLKFDCTMTQIEKEKGFDRVQKAIAANPEEDEVADDGAKMSAGAAARRKKTQLWKNNNPECIALKRWKPTKQQMKSILVPRAE